MPRYLDPTYESIYLYTKHAVISSKHNNNNDMTPQQQQQHVVVVTFIDNGYCWVIRQSFVFVHYWIITIIIIIIGIVFDASFHGPITRTTIGNGVISPSFYSVIWYVVVVAIDTMEMLPLIPLLPTTTTTTTTTTTIGSWRLPNYTMAEGPMHYGYDHTYLYRL
jgi:hypothetical protein